MHTSPKALSWQPKPFGQVPEVHGTTQKLRASAASPNTPDLHTRPGGLLGHATPLPQGATQAVPSYLVMMHASPCLQRRLDSPAGPRQSWFWSALRDPTAR